MKTVIIGDNSAILKGFIKDLLESTGEFKISGMTANGEDIIKLHSKEFADLIIIGENISLIDEIETAKIITSTKPTNIVILKPMSSKKDLSSIDGTVSVILKPGIDEIQDKAISEKFISDLRNAAEIRSLNNKIIDGLKNKYRDVSIETCELKPLIVLGASTGGPKTIQYILEQMPADFPIGIALVQHFEEGFEQGFVDWLNGSTPLTVRLAEKKDFPKPGEVIIAPQGLHMKAEGSFLIMTEGPKVNNQKPAVDVLFSTAAKIYKEKLIGILLTGMGRDGAEGCRDIVLSGGFTIVQDKDSSIVYGMPKEAAALNGASIIMGYTQIADYLIKNIKERVI